LGRLLIFIVLFSLPALVIADDELSGLASKANISGERIVQYVKSGVQEYSEDPTIKACLKKAETDKNKAIYALFNYIMYLDLQNSFSSSNSLKETRKLITVSRYAKKSVNYCNR